MNTPQPNQSILKIVIVFLLFTGASLAILSLSMGENTSKFTGKFMSICFIALIYGILAALSYSLYFKEHFKGLSLTSVIVCVVGFTLASFMIIFEIENSGMARATFALFVTSIALAQICRLYNIVIVNKYAHISRIAASSCIALFTIILLMLIFSTDIEVFSMFRRNPIPETFSRSFMGLLALDFSLTAATPLLNKMDYGRYETEDIEEEFLKGVEE